MRFLARASRRLAESPDYEDTLLAIAGLALPFPRSWCIADVVEANGSLRRLDIVHPDPTKQADARRLKDGWPPPRAAGDDPLGMPRAILDRTSELIPRVSDEMLVDVASSAENLQDLRALGIGSIVVVPLVARDHVHGALTFLSADVGHQYTEADRELAEALAALCATALDHARLLGDTRAAREEAEEARSRAARLNERLVVASMLQQELAEEAWEANQAKTRFLSTMSHEIRTPLNAIVGYADLLDSEIAGPITVQQREYLTRLLASSQHLIGIIDDILDLAKLEAGRLLINQDILSASESVTSALALVEPQAKLAGVSVRTDFPSGDNDYVGDGDRVRQILVILLSNALKFTDRGGSITVSCGASQAPDAAAALPGSGPWTLLRVEDTGIGISVKAAETVFQPFVQVDASNTRKQGGAGLGLSIGLELARRMGGDLTLRSVEGEGSCFTLWLPGAPPAGAVTN